jgi:hypothetical protein
VFSHVGVLLFHRLECSNFLASEYLMQLQQHTLNIKEQEVSSRVPQAKASEALMPEAFGNSKEETEDLPSELATPMKKANLSVAELLEDLQGRSNSSVGAASVCFLWCCFMV